MPLAEIIAIGSELLLGDTLDTNTQYLLQHFREMGIDVYRTMIIGDNPERISQVIRDAVTRCDILITTGGLGPTIDDPTRQAVSMAFDCEQVYKEDLWTDISAYFRKMDRIPPLNNKRQAYIPACAEGILNPVGTAPAFYIFKNGTLTVSLPGVPREMKYLFENAVTPLIQKYFQVSGCICMRNLHSIGIGEADIDVLVGDLEERANPTLGLCAKSGQIDLRITAKADTQDEAERLVNEFDAIIRARLGKSVYGKDEDTIKTVVNRLIAERGFKVRIFENNCGGNMKRLFNDSALSDCVAVSLENPKTQMDAFFAEQYSDTVSAAISLTSLTDGFTFAEIRVSDGEKTETLTRHYNPLSFDDKYWQNWALNAVRLLLQD